MLACEVKPHVHKPSDFLVSQIVHRSLVQHVPLIGSAVSKSRSSSAHICTHTCPPAATNVHLRPQMSTCGHTGHLTTRVHLAYLPIQDSCMFARIPVQPLASIMEEVSAPGELRPNCSAKLSCTVVLMFTIDASELAPTPAAHNDAHIGCSPFQWTLRDLQTQLIRDIKRLTSYLLFSRNVSKMNGKSG